MMSNTARRRGFPFRYLVLVLLVGAAAVVWFVLERPQKAVAPAAPLPVDVILPAQGTIEKTITIDSAVQSNSVVTVLPKVSGTITAMSADIGTRLSAGDTIARIDPAPYQLALNQAGAAYDGAMAIYDRTKKLYDSGATSQQNYDQARTQFDATRAQYDLAKLHLGYTDITSPVSGTVVRKLTSVGALVSQSVPIVTISDTRALIVSTQIPEMDVRMFESNRHTIPVRASIPAAGQQEYRLRITHIAPAIDVRTRTFNVQCGILGNTSAILPGMFASVTFVTDRRSNIHYLPYTALVGGNTLWYVDAQERARSMAFTPSYHNDTYFEVPSAYANRRFILAGQHFLNAGDLVRVASTSRAGK